MTLLAWTEDSRHTSTGRAGAVRLFHYTWDGSRQHPGEPWVMASDLPGHEGQRWRAADPETLQGTAEGVLSAWLKSIGAGA